MGIHDLDPWLADCSASDVRYLKHYYETGEKLHLDELWKTGSPLLDPLPIPQFTPRRLKLRSAGVVI